jgi:hypothetical protein
MPAEDLPIFVSLDIRGNLAQLEQDQMLVWTIRVAERIETLTRISQKLSTAAVDPAVSTSEPSVARLVSAPVPAASIRNPMRNAG